MSVRCVALAMLAVAAGGCFTASQGPRRGSLAPTGREAREIVSFAFSGDGASAHLLSRVSGKCRLEVVDTGTRTVTNTIPLDGCPSSITRRDGRFLLAGGGGSTWFDPSTLALERSEAVIDAIDREQQIIQRNTALIWKHDRTELSLRPGLSAPRILRHSNAILAISTTHDGKRLVRLTPAGREISLTEVFDEIDSFDVAPSEKEIVFSARRSGQFDVGLVSADGGEPRWIAPDPADETSVTWAPRGNKVSYVVDTFNGALIRTVHIPTSFQLAVDFPSRHLGPIVWEPRAERFAVVTNTPLMSDQIELLRYNGEDRTLLVQPSQTVDAEVSPLTSDREGVLIRPKTIRYGVRLPLVIWLTRVDPRAWSEARANVVAELAVGIAVVRGDMLWLEKAWSSLTADEWIDPNRVVVVDLTGARPAAAFRGPQRFVLAGNPALLEAGWRLRSRASGREVVEIDGDDVESLAAAYLIGSLKGSAPR